MLFRSVLAALVADPAPLLEMIRVAQDAKFGDYQANFAMSLGKQLGKPPQVIANEIVAAVQPALEAICLPLTVAGPGFINIKLRDDWLAKQIQRAAAEERVGIETTKAPRTFVIDYSGPNVAKPMHVGHIRSTVIGDALCRTLRFLGHRVISDNHLGDWGTQFGMIIYGYKHFVDRKKFAANPVAELSRLYKLVHQLVDYRESQRSLPDVTQKLALRKAELLQQRELAKSGDKGIAKKATEQAKKFANQVQELTEELESLEKKIAAVEAHFELFPAAKEHPRIDEAVLAETAKLHAGDAENLRLWHEFLPNCRDEIQKVYSRLDVHFDHEYGESFYHDLLAGVVADLRRRGLATDSQGAVCVFLDGFEAPMIVQKKDGAFLYSTTDLATIQYRMETWAPNAILYVVDHRQGEHFEKLFAAAKCWGYQNLELAHVKFGTVMGKDGKPYKTRSGDTVGLEGLLDEAVQRAAAIVAANDDAKPSGAELAPAERRHVAQTVGIGALKYADLSHNRVTDYEFDYDKMLAMTGNTATYMQYCYARVQSIFARGGVRAEDVRASGAKVVFQQPQERALAIQILRISESLADMKGDYMPHHLTGYLFDLAKSYSAFFENCPVLKAESAEIRASRLLLCDLTARAIKLGLSLLGIGVPEKM